MHLHGAQCNSFANVPFTSPDLARRIPNSPKPIFPLVIAISSLSLVIASPAQYIVTFSRMNVSISSVIVSAATDNASPEKCFARLSQSIARPSHLDVCPSPDIVSAQHDNDSVEKCFAQLAKCNVSLSRANVQPSRSFVFLSNRFDLTQTVRQESFLVAKVPYSIQAKELHFSIESDILAPQSFSHGQSQIIHPRRRG